jgi:hypothetical protein
VGAASLEGLFRTELEGEGLSESEIECVLDGLNEEFTTEEFDAAYKEYEDTGETPSDFTQAAEAAVSDC